MGTSVVFLLLGYPKNPFWSNTSRVKQPPAQWVFLNANAVFPNSSPFGKGTSQISGRKSQSPPHLSDNPNTYSVIPSLFFSRNYALEELIKQWPKQWKYMTLTPWRFSPKHKRNAINFAMWKEPRKMMSRGASGDFGGQEVHKEGRHWDATVTHKRALVGALFSWGPSAP